MKALKAQKFTKWDFCLALVVAVPFVYLIWMSPGGKVDEETQFNAIVIELVWAAACMVRLICYKNERLRVLTEMANSLPRKREQLAKLQQEIAALEKNQESQL